ncbi:Methyltransferase type 12 [Thiorhodococcus drewsii AZ1]|uniref:Methyltransferase type 12 n=1 Tax=Thiorhodococcus drewsii AZ1 TaxID=765913 RepID=G2E4L4_9GAMM|nr:class I SAM-dependent methyltransferase [Thiorhodococcus drewsii]EGV29635.1 Methyltransferase type 12 [Thiorhodococcus drewsii AZ1]
MKDIIGSYYDQHAQAFVDDTLTVDMTPLYSRFLPLLPPTGHILDAGCGSGRDAHAFRDLGYQVSACDASPTLAHLASVHCGLPVQVMRFQEITWQERFDGIWACASLLHVPQAELTDALSRLSAALKPAGLLYASFKYGQGEREHRGRRFTDLDEPGLAELLRQVGNLVELETWTTGDLRPGREAERWLNTLLRKPGSAWPST